MLTLFFSPFGNVIAELFCVRRGNRLFQGFLFCRVLNSFLPSQEPSFAPLEISTLKPFEIDGIVTT